MSKRLVIIGSNSFLARSAAKYFARDYVVDGYGSNINCESYSNIRAWRLPDQDLDFEELITNTDVILYCAAGGVQSSSKGSEQLTYELNCVWPMKLVLGLERVGYSGTLITFGSYFEAGESSMDEPIQLEDFGTKTSQGSLGSYISSKQLFTNFAGKYQATFQHLHLVLPTIYGPKEASHRLIQMIAQAVKSGKSELNFSSGQQVRQYLFVDDLCALIGLLVEQKSLVGPQTVGLGQILTVRELVISIIKGSGSSLKSNWGAIQTRDVGMPYLALKSSSAIEALTKQMSTTSLKEGFAQYLSNN